MGAFKHIATKLMLNLGRHDGKNGLTPDELVFLWTYNREDYYRVTGRKNGPKTVSVNYTEEEGKDLPF